MPDFNPAPSSDYQLQIEVRPEYLPEESNPPRQYLFAYHVTITNTGSILLLELETGSPHN